MKGLRIASGFAQRVRGLLGAGEYEGQLLLAPCRDIHTFGMKHDIDVAFLDDAGRILRVERDVAPSRRLKCRHARAVVERRSCPNEQWYEEGQHVVLVQACPKKGEQP